MNDNSDSVTASDIVSLAVCIVGLLTSLAAIVVGSPCAGVVGVALLFVGLAYFGILQAVDA